MTKLANLGSLRSVRDPESAVVHSECPQYVRSPQLVEGRQNPPLDFPPAAGPVIFRKLITQKQS
jgi:hypothetical protein